MESTLNTPSNKTCFSLSLHMHVKCTPSDIIASVYQPACHCPRHKMEFKDLLPSPPARKGTQHDISQQTSTHHPALSQLPTHSQGPLGSLCPGQHWPQRMQRKSSASVLTLKRNCWLNIKYLSLSSCLVLHIK